MYNSNAATNDQVSAIVSQNIHTDSSLDISSSMDPMKHQQEQQQQQLHQPPQFYQQNTFHPSSSSSYTSTTSPSNFVSYNSPTANPPHSSLLHRNSFNSRTSSLDTNSSLPNLSHSFGNTSFISQSNASSFAPAGRRSLLTTKLQSQSQIQTQTQPQQTQQLNDSSIHNPFLRKSSFNHIPLSNTPSQVSSSYSSNYNITTFDTQHQIGFTPQPTPATATTDVTKDIAFSTTSSSSTLYQDAQMPPPPPHPQSQQQYLHLHHQFISASAPTNPTSTYDYNYQPNFITNDISNNISSSVSKHRPLEQLEQFKQTSIHSTNMQPPITQNTTELEHLNIAEHPVQDLLLMLSALLQKIVEANDMLHPDPHAVHNNSDSSNKNNSSNNNNNGSSSISNGTNFGVGDSCGVGGLLGNNKYTANVLAFHGRNIPAISLHAYLTRILKYCPVTNDVFLSLLVYFDRIAKRANNNTNNNNNVKDIDGDGDDKMGDDVDSNVHEEGNIGKNSNNETKKSQVFVMDSYNIHRLIISGITVASKFFSDVFYKNSRYAKVGGLPLDELNHLELQFLLLLDFKLMIQVEEMNRYGDLLLKFWKREQMKKEQESS